LEKGVIQLPVEFILIIFIKIDFFYKNIKNLFEVTVFINSTKKSDQSWDLYLGFLN